MSKYVTRKNTKQARAETIRRKRVREFMRKNSN